MSCRDQPAVPGWAAVNQQILFPSPVLCYQPARPGLLSLRDPCDLARGWKSFCRHEFRLCAKYFANGSLVSDSRGSRGRIQSCRRGLHPCHRRAPLPGRWHRHVQLLDPCHRRVPFLERWHRRVPFPLHWHPPPHCCCPHHHPRRLHRRLRRRLHCCCCRLLHRRFRRRLNCCCCRLLHRHYRRRLNCCSCRLLHRHYRRRLNCCCCRLLHRRRRYHLHLLLRGPRSGAGGLRRS